MKLRVTLLALLLCATPALGEDNQAKLDKKLAEGWITDPAWITDYDDALAQAKETGKPIFGYFTRSYSY